MTNILLTVSVTCNVWFLFLLLYDRIMETRLVRFFKDIAGVWNTLHAGEQKKETEPGARTSGGYYRQEPFQNDNDPDNDYHTGATSCHFGGRH